MFKRAFSKVAKVVIISICCKVCTMVSRLEVNAKKRLQLKQLAYGKLLMKP